jgi:hypothetical protein
MATSHTPTQNRILAVLPATERERVYPQLELVPMPLGRQLSALSELALKLGRAHPYRGARSLHQRAQRRHVDA